MKQRIKKNRTVAPLWPCCQGGAFGCRGSYGKFKLNECNGGCHANYGVVGRKLSITLSSSMTMQYIPFQFLCHRHPFLAPGALASMYEVASSADKM